MDKIKKTYEKLPKEFRVFVEYILPSAIVTAGIDYFSGLEVNDLYLGFAVNLILIFLREVKPRYEKIRK
jgi:hypothetical protein